MDHRELKAAWQTCRRGALILVGSAGAALYLWHVSGAWTALAVVSATILLLAVVDRATASTAGKESAEAEASTTGDAKADDAARQIIVAKVGIATAILVGAAGITTYAAQFETASAFLAVGSGAAFVAGASLVTGSFLGFLFGIPRAAASEAIAAKGTGASPKDSDGPAAAAAVEYRANTNLEQISDWLTKILVGVGLTQLTKLPSALQAYATSVEPLLGGTAAAGRFGIALSVYFLVAGFMVGYLWTRLELGGALRAADLASIGRRTAEVESKVQLLERQAALDANALGMASLVLNPGKDAPPPRQEELDEAFRAASPSVRVQVFYRAEELRSANWRDAATKPKMARAIPIFRALVASDTEDRYHRNHGELAFALKDQPQPDWKEAEAELSKAIATRGDPLEHGWVLYEFNRAICRMHLDAEFTAQRPSSKGARDEIVRDLRAAMLAENLGGVVMGDPTISAWLQLNHVAEKDLR